jgi:hypothetical protein
MNKPAFDEAPIKPHFSRRDHFVRIRTILHALRKPVKRPWKRNAAAEWKLKLPDVAVHKTGRELHRGKRSLHVWL